MPNKAGPTTTTPPPPWLLARAVSISRDLEQLAGAAEMLRRLCVSGQPASALVLHTAASGLAEGLGSAVYAIRMLSEDAYGLGMGFMLADGSVVAGQGGP